MSIRTIPGKRWTDQREPGEDVTYPGLAATAFPRAIIEPETVGIRELALADAGAILATAPIGIATNFIKSGDATVTAGQTIELPDKKNVIGAITSMVVVFAQADPQVIFSGFIVIEPTTDGTDPIPRVVIRAHNISSSSRTILDTTNIQFICLLAAPQPQPTTPNAELIIIPKRTWSGGAEPVDITGLNNTANPTAALKPNSIGKVELNSADTLTLASRFVGLRGTFTVAVTTAVPVGTNVTLGTSTITGAVIGKPVIVAQPGRSVPLYTGYVSGADTISVHARNNGFGAASIPAGTVLNIVVLQ